MSPACRPCCWLSVGWLEASLSLLGDTDGLNEVSGFSLKRFQWLSLIAKKSFLFFPLLLLLPSQRMRTLRGVMGAQDILRARPLPLFVQKRDIQRQTGWGRGWLGGDAVPPVDPIYRNGPFNVMYEQLLHSWSCWRLRVLGRFPGSLGTTWGVLLRGVRVHVCVCAYVCVLLYIYI